MAADVEGEAEAVFGGSAVRKDENDTAGGAEIGERTGAFGDGEERGGEGGVPVAREGKLEIGRGEEDEAGLLRGDEGGGGAPVFFAEAKFVAEDGGGSGIVGGKRERDAGGAGESGEKAAATGESHKAEGYEEEDDGGLEGEVAFVNEFEPWRKK